jgi:hypothetical protein
MEPRKNKLSKSVPPEGRGTGILPVEFADTGWKPVPHKRSKIAQVAFFRGSYATALTEEPRLAGRAGRPECQMRWSTAGRTISRCWSVLG